MKPGVSYYDVYTKLVWDVWIEILFQIYYMEVLSSWLPLYFGRNLTYESNRKFNVTIDLYPIFGQTNMLFLPRITMTTVNFLYVKSIK